jgi:hypothetical protein
MTHRNKSGAARGAHVRRRRRLRLAIVLLVGIVVGGAGFLLYKATQSDNGSSTGQGGSGDVVELPQNPSLKLLFEGGIWHVENDGNVTMSEVQVRDPAGAVICDLGTLSPTDRHPCEDAGDRQDLVAAGQGPQGQKVEVPPG